MSSTHRIVQTIADGGATIDIVFQDGNRINIVKHNIVDYRIDDMERYPNTVRIELVHAGRDYYPETVNASHIISLPGLTGIGLLALIGTWMAVLVAPPPPSPPSWTTVSSGDLVLEPGTIDAPVGNIAAGNWYVQFWNKGTSSGTYTLNGVVHILEAGEWKEFQGYSDPATMTLHRVGAIDYDATGTHFIVSIKQ